MVASSPPPTGTSRIRRAIAYAVHVYTASGVLCGALAVAAIVQHDNRIAFFWMTLAVLIDATDGALARRFSVREVLPDVDGRKLDDIVDYLNYTFVPILMICESDWLPHPARVWATFPLVASLFGFVNSRAKQDDEGFFLGFPSYWNIVAFYVAVWLHRYGQHVVLGMVLSLSVLSVAPVRFVYPNRAPRWRRFFVGGGMVWLAILLAMLCVYPKDVPSWMIGISAVYPVLYVVLSLYLDLENRRRSARSPPVS
jgi:phosphatidylcholine synthase